jgi:hypothetical protein
MGTMAEIEAKNIGTSVKQSSNFRLARHSRPQSGDDFSVTDSSHISACT